MSDAKSYLDPATFAQVLLGALEASRAEVEEEIARRKPPLGYRFVIYYHLAAAAGPGQKPELSVKAKLVREDGKGDCSPN